MSDQVNDTELIAIIRADIATVGSIRRWCEIKGFDVSNVSRILAGKRPITDKLALEFGYVKSHAWVREPK